MHQKYFFNEILGFDHFNLSNERFMEAFKSIGDFSIN
jgi:hypothetical protein